MKNFIFLIGTVIYILVLFAQANSTNTQGHEKMKKYYKVVLAPQNENFVDSAPNTVTYSLVVPFSAAKVWKIITNYSTWTQWFPKMKESKGEDSSKTGLHSKRLVRIGSMKLYQDIIVWKQNKAWGFTILESNKRIFKRAVEIIYLEATDENSTRLIYKGGFEYGGIFNLFKKMVNKKLISNWEKAFQSLNEYIENKKS